MRKTTRESEKKRITLDVTPEFYERLEHLERSVQARSKAEVIRDALQLYEYVADRQQAGWRFQARTEAGEIETLVFLDLPTQVTRSAKAVEGMG